MKKLKTLIENYSYKLKAMVGLGLSKEETEDFVRNVAEGVFLKIKNDEMKDRFFLEEIVFRLSNNDYEYVRQLSHDWLKEMIKNNPLTEEERAKFLKDVIGADEAFFPYFNSEKELLNKLQN